MKSYSLWGVLATSSFAALAACSVTTNNINTTEGGTGDDAATDGGGSSSGAGSSSGGSSSGASSSGGSSSGAASDAGDGGSCRANLTIGAAACDTCMKANCCAELITCDTPGDAGVDDAGLTSCEQSLDCVVGLSSTSDAGISQALSDCFGGDASAAPADLTGLLSCASTHCFADCN